MRRTARCSCAEDARRDASAMRCSTSSARCRSRSRTPTPSTDAEQRAVRRARHAAAAGRLAALARAGAVRRRGAADARRRRCCSAQDWAAGVAAAVDRSRSPTQDWVRADAGAVRADRDRARVLDRAELARRRRPQARQRDPARPGPRVRHRHASDHAPVPALDRATTRARRLAARARLRLRLGHPRHRRGAASARAAIDAVDIDPAAVDVDARQRARQRRRARTPALPDAAQRRATTLVLANILATPLKLLAPLLCGASRAGRRPGAGRHPRAPGRRADARPMRRGCALEVADSDDGWILMTAARGAHEREPHGMIAAP